MRSFTGLAHDYKDVYDAREPSGRSKIFIFNGEFLVGESKASSIGNVEYLRDMADGVVNGQFSQADFNRITRNKIMVMGE